MPGIFVGYTFLKAHSIPVKMALVSTLFVEAFWRDGMINTLPICHVTVYTKSVMKYADNKFLIDKIVILTPNIILIDSKYDKTNEYVHEIIV